MTPLTGWILQHFPHISVWTFADGYTEQMPCACAYEPLRGNQATLVYRVYLDQIVHQDIHFNINVDHCETIAFDEVSLFTGWLACGTWKTAAYMPERVMCQFEYTQMIPQHPALSAPPTVKRREMYEIFVDLESHLVPKEARSTVTPDDWSYAYLHVVVL